MKELLDKFLSLFSQGIAKMEENDSEEAIKKFKEASSMSESLQKKAEDVLEKSQIKKFFEGDEGKETLKKYADLYVSGKDMTELMEQIKELVGKTEDISKKIDSLEKEKQTDDEVISKTLDNAIDRVENLEKQMDTTRVSKIN